MVIRSAEKTVTRFLETSYILYYRGDLAKRAFDEVEIGVVVGCPTGKFGATEGIRGYAPATRVLAQVYCAWNIGAREL